MTVQEINQIRMLASRARGRDIAQYLFKQTGGLVQDGPFKGMQLVAETGWNDQDLSAKLLGFYEQELHRLLPAQGGREYERVINIGCAEGYYTVGMARLLPESAVIGFDLNAKSLEACRKNAEVNGVSDRVSAIQGCTVEQLAETLADGRKSFLLVDCEGAEKALLDPVRIPALGQCDILVECHDFIDQSITSTLVARLQATHKIVKVVEGARDPNSSLLLRKLNSLDRWLAVCEHRPLMMHWLLCQANQA